jgi:predicted nucleotidyltransferase
MFLAGHLVGALSDVDFGIAVRDWDHFKTLKSALVEQGGFASHVRMVQRLIYN